MRGLSKTGGEEFRSQMSSLKLVGFEERQKCFMLIGPSPLSLRERCLTSGQLPQEFSL